MEFNPETWIAISSAVTAVCALGVTVWQGRQNYKHNKLSVRPMLTTIEGNHKKDNIGFVSFTLENCGVGPAIIKKFVLLNGNEEVSINNIKTYDDFLRKITHGCYNVYTGALVPDSSMPINSKHMLLSFNYDTQKQDISFAHSLNLIVEYQSIYQDETFTYDSRKDRKFHGRDEICASTNGGHAA